MALQCSWSINVGCGFLTEVSRLPHQDAVFEVTRIADTVVMCFPQRWGTLGGDDSGSEIIQQLLESLDHEQIRNRITKARELAYFIIDRCAANIFDPSVLTDKRSQFLEFFNESIENLVSYVSSFRHCHRLTIPD
jgi:hypothetical protein